MNKYTSLLLFTTFTAIGFSCSQVIVSFYLLSSANIQFLILYRIFELIPIIPFAVLTGFLIDRKSPKFSMSISLILRFLQMLGILLLGTQIQSYVFIVAFLSGAANVTQFVSTGLLIKQQLGEDNQEKYYAHSTVIAQVLSITFPIISGLLITFTGYVPLFIVAALLALSGFFLLFRFTSATQQNYFSITGAFKQWNSQLTQAWTTNFLWGSEFILISLLFPIIIFKNFGGAFGWGIISGLIAVLTIGFTMLVHKLSPKNTLLFYGLSGFALSSLALTFVANDSFYILLPFLLCSSLWQAAQSFGLRPSLVKLVSALPKSNVYETEYTISLEIPFLLGRLIVLIILYYLASIVNNTFVLGMLLLVFSLIPLYEIYFYFRKNQSSSLSK